MKELRIDGQKLLGIIVVLAGIILLLDGLDYLPGDMNIFTFAPLVLVVYGAVKMSNKESSTILGLDIFLIGCYFQLNNFEVQFIKEPNFVKLFWPLILILFGVSLVMPRRVFTKS